MEIRTIKPEETEIMRKVQSVAFNYSYTEPEEHKVDERWDGEEVGRAAFNENGKMCACLELLPYRLRFDGQTVYMAGIGGVATLPEERRRGYVRKLFRHCFEEMRERDQIFSYLFPFSFAYYRQFGYELGLSLQRVTISLSEFSQFPHTGHVSLFEPGDDRTDILRIYDSFIQDKNIAVVRNKGLWDGWLGGDPYKTNRYTYIWHNDQGVAGSYVQLEMKDRKEGERYLAIRELAWTDEPSLFGILGYLNHYAAQCREVVWELGEFLNVSLLFRELHKVKVEKIPFGMNRIVDLQKVLEKMAYPEESGEMVLEVKDDFLEWNSGVYTVAWGGRSVRVSQGEKQPDLSCDIQSISQLITGFVTLDELKYRNQVKVYKNHSTLSSVFVKKPLYLNDRF